MAKDVRDAGDAIGSVLGTIAREVSHSVSHNGHSKVPFRNGSDNGFSGSRGIAAGAVLASAAPLAGKAVKRLVMKRVAGSGAEKEKGEKGAPGLVKKIGEKVLPGGGGDSKGKGTPGVGKGRRMPVQQAVDIGVPLAVAYNQWTQFEEWPQFMHRLDQATQEDDCTVSFRTKVWGMSKEFTGQIVEQRPDERIQWSVEEGVIHTGVVTFHELAPRLTRVQVTLDVEPGSLIEKAARGMRHVKRAVRADLARFKAFIEMQEVETGAWRGVIHDGELVEDHDKDQGSKQSSSRRSGSSSSKRRTRGSGSSGKTSSKARSSSGRSRSTKKRSRSGSSRKRSPSRS